MEGFRYRPLDPREPTFRLLRLLKGCEVEVRCEIFHASISGNGAVAYEALSCTWGGGELVDCIELNHNKVWITDNLHSALQCLRFRDEDRILWVDAICINQLDKEEQSQQVQKMGTIFGSAKQVIFWLGKQTAEVELLMSSLSEFQQMSASVTHESWKGDDVRWKGLWSSVLPPLDSQPHTLEIRQRRGLLQLLKRPWFERIWIVQEVANSHSAVVCSGTSSISARIFALSPLLLEVTANPHRQSILDIMHGPARTESWWSQKRDLYSLLLKFRASKATDERDMIFALLGMSSEPQDNENLRIDYTKPIHEVVHKAIYYWLETTSITVSEILHLLTGFKTVHAVYLIPLESPGITREVLQLPLQLGKNLNMARRASDFAQETIGCIRKASLFLLEERRGESFANEDTLYTEIENLQSNLNTDIPEDFVRYYSELRVISWKENVKLLIVGKSKEALLIVALNGLRRTCDVILDRSPNDRQKLLDSALDEALRRYYQLDRAIQGYGRNRAIQGYEQAVQMLLETGADINVQGGIYGSALQAASALGNEMAVRELLKLGADVNAQGGTYGNALQTASASGNETVVQKLLEAGADINAQGGRYGNALQAASAKGHGTLVQILRDYGAHVLLET